MPELPEVETTLRGLEPHVIHQTILKIIIRKATLRFPIPKDITRFETKNIQALKRRGKYLLLVTDEGTLIIHLGMSGRLRILSKETIINKHDHFDIVFSNKKILRYTDPRRFGAFLYVKNNSDHPLLKTLGVEPLTDDFNAEYLFEKLKKKTLPIKSAIMDSKIVVGVGNIYATEALHQAKIHPASSAKKLSIREIKKLVAAIKAILLQAIEKGGTTLKDFSDSNGKPGYFVQKLKAYGRADLPCYFCKSPLKSMQIGQRSSVFCEKCQVDSA